MASKLEYISLSSSSIESHDLRDSTVIFVCTYSQGSESRTDAQMTFFQTVRTFSPSLSIQATAASSSNHSQYKITTPKLSNTMQARLSDVAFVFLLIIALISQDPGMIHASKSVPGHQQNAKSMLENIMQEISALKVQQSKTTQILKSLYQNHVGLAQTFQQHENQVHVLPNQLNQVPQPHQAQDPQVPDPLTPIRETLHQLQQRLERIEYRVDHLDHQQYHQIQFDPTKSPSKGFIPKSAVMELFGIFAQAKDLTFPFKSQHYKCIRRPPPNSNFIDCEFRQGLGPGTNHPLWIKFLDLVKQQLVPKAGDYRWFLQSGNAPQFAIFNDLSGYRDPQTWAQYKALKLSVNVRENPLLTVVWKANIQH